MMLYFLYVSIIVKYEVISNKLSDLVTNGHPLFPQIVSSSKNLQIVPVGHQFLYILVYLFWLLTLTPSVAEYHISSHSLLQFVRISFNTYQTGLLCMLKIISVSLGNFSVNSLLDPSDRVNNFVPPLLHQLDSEHIFGINGPDDEHSIFL